MKSFPLTHPAFLILGLLGLLAVPLAHADSHPGDLSMDAVVDPEAQTVSVSVTNAVDITSELVLSLEGPPCSVSVTDNTTGESLLAWDVDDCPGHLKILMTEVAKLAGENVADLLRLTAGHIILGLSPQQTTFTATQRQTTDGVLIEASDLIMDSERHQDIVNTLSDKATLTKPSLDPQKIQYKGDATDSVLGVETKFSVDQDPGVPQQQRITK